MTDQMIITRAIEISASADDVAAWITDFHRWQSWSPWEGLDENLSRTYSGPGRGVGTHYAWSGNRKAGQGTMEITAVEPSRILIDLTFLKPFKSASTTTFELTPSADSVAVSWSVASPKTLGMRIAGIFMNFEKSVGGDLERGLAMLKKSAENV